MPESPEVNLENIADKATKLISEFGGNVHKTDKKPIAFGLIAIELTFIMDESKGSTDSLEEQINGVKGVNSVEVIDVRRTIG